MPAYEDDESWPSLGEVATTVKPVGSFKTSGWVCFRLWYQDVNISLVSRPPPFLPSVCVCNITFCSCVLLWTQTEGKSGGGLEMRLMWFWASCNNDPLQLSKFSILSAMNAGSIEHNVSIINYVLNEIVEWSSTEMKGETTCEIKLFPEVLHSVNNFIQHIFTTWSRTISWDGSASGCEYMLNKVIHWMQNFRE